MDKKGIVLELGAIFIIIVTTVGALYVFSESGHIYVGNNINKKFYDYKICPTEVINISEQNRVIFENKEKAMNEGYGVYGGCVKWTIIYLGKRC